MFVSFLADRIWTRKHLTIRWHLTALAAVGVVFSVSRERNSGVQLHGELQG